MSKRLFTAGALASILCSQGCSGPDKEQEPAEFDAVTAAHSQMTTPDLNHYELVGPVKSCRRTTFFDVMRVDDRLVPDTTGVNHTESTAYFDELGGYVAKSGERIRRDEQGRIIRWEDRHPNYATIHPGFLRDTLAYEYIDANTKRANGRGSSTLVITDDLGNILAQQSVSTRPRHNTAAANIYRRYDDRGNWTERLTVWTTQVAGDSIPRVRYSIDQRKLVYYP